MKGFKNIIIHGLKCGGCVWEFNSQWYLGARAILTLKVFDKMCKTTTKETKIVGIAHVNGANNLSYYYYYYLVDVIVHIYNTLKKNCEDQEANWSCTCVMVKFDLNPPYLDQWSSNSV